MKKIIYVTLALSVIFSSCKKGTDKTDEPTPAAVSREITRSDLYPENGYISGTIISKLSDGSSFQKSFHHELDLDASTCYLNADGRYVIHLNKADKSGRLGVTDKKTQMTFILNVANNAVHSLVSSNSSIYVDSTSAAITKFEIEQTIPSASIMTISNVNFNPTNGTFTADYTMNYNHPNYTSSQKYATIIGRINTTLINLRYRTGS